MTGWSRLFLDPLVGRDDDLRTLLEALSERRLVTLTGPGGSGKTRLAAAAVATLREGGRDAWFVDCSAVEDASILGATIAAALDLKDEKGREPMDLIVTALNERTALLALDNLEQFAGAGDAAGRLLEELPSLSILGTSRVPLRVVGEAELPVAPLELPADATAQAVLASPAGQLFLRRAGALTASPSLDDATAAEIATLLRRLDGMPLAIELAAARTRVLSPGEINRRLDARGPDAIDQAQPDEHRSLRSIIDWTVGQLSPADVEALHALSVCAGFDLALAEALLPEVDVVPTIESLITFGLIQRAEAVNGGSRFRLLVTIQAAVGRRLRDEERTQFRDRHAAHFLALATEWERSAASGAVHETAAAFDADADNIRRALDHLEVTDPRAGLVLLASLPRFWSSRGRFREGWERFNRARAAAERPSPELVAAALKQVLSIWIAMPHSELIDLEDWTLDAARIVGDQALLEDALRLRAIAAGNENDLARVREIQEEFEALPAGDDHASRMRRLAMELNLAQYLEGRASDQFLRLAREYLAALRAAGDGLALGASADLAGALFHRGAYEESASQALEAARTFLDLGREGEAAWAMAWLAPSLAESGHTTEAVEALLECIALSIRAGNAENIASSLWAAMPVALALGQPLLAARLYGALVRGMYARHETVLVNDDRNKASEWLGRATRAAPSLAIELAVRDGERADPVQMVESLPELLRAAGPAVGPRAVLRHGTLTKREVEVLTLVGRGRSDPEIAEALFISPKTASVHVSNIKGKLGVASRLEMALRARELGLVEPPGSGRAS